MPTPTQAVRSETKNYNPLWDQMFFDDHSDINSALQAFRHKFGQLASDDQCQLCTAPFDGPIVKERSRNSKNPEFCDACDKFMREHFPGKTDLHPCPCISIDVVGSSEVRNDEDYLEDVQKPFEAQTFRALCKHDGFLENYRGDELRGLYPRGFSGDDNAKQALDTALFILQNPIKNHKGKPINVRIGLHIGPVQIYSRGDSPETFSGCGIVGAGINLCSYLTGEKVKGGAYEALITDNLFKEIGIQPVGPVKEITPKHIKEGEEEVIYAHVVTKSNVKTIEKFLRQSS